jgi:uncharacterized protein HemX
MASGNDEMNYKNLFRKNEERTDIPEFEDILNLPVKTKKQASGLSKLSYAIILCAAAATGAYYFVGRQHETQIAKRETQLLESNKEAVWNWKSPTQQLLTASFKITDTNFKLPTDYFLPQETSFKIDNNKK